MSNLTIGSSTAADTGLCRATDDTGGVLQMTDLNSDSWEMDLSPGLQDTLNNLKGNDHLSPADKQKFLDAIVQKALTEFDTLAGKTDMDHGDLDGFRKSLETGLRSGFDSLDGSSGGTGASGGNGSTDGGLQITKSVAQDLSKMDIQSLLFFVMSERAGLLDDQVRSQASEIQDRNNLMKLTNQMMEVARNKVAGLKDGESADMPDDMKGFFVSNGIAYTGKPDSTSSSSGGVITASPSTSGGPAEAKYEAAQAKLTKLQSEIDAGNTAKNDLDNIGYIDHVAIKKSVPDSTRTFCSANDITVDHTKVNIGQRDDLKNKIQNAIAKKQSEYNTQNAEMDQLKAAADAEKTGGTTAGGSSTTPTATTSDVDTSSVTTSQTKDQWNANVENLKSFSEGLNNQSQMDMIKFQNTMSKLTTQLEALSNTMKKLQDNQASLVANLH